MITLENIEIIKAKKRILKNVNITINPADRVLIHSRNGSGKTSLLKCIAGLEKANNGNVIFYKKGEKISRSDAVLSYLPELSAIDDSMMVKKLIRGFVLCNDLKKVKNPESFVKMLHDNLNIELLQNQYFGTLSKGEKKRVLIYICLLTNSNLLLLDEPYDGLDLYWREQITKLIIESLNINEHRMIIISSHIYDEKIDLSYTKLLTINNGSVGIRAA